MLNIKVNFLLCLILFTIIISITIPLSIQDGLSDYDEEELLFAKKALSMANLHLDNPIQKALVMNKKVERIEKTEGKCKFSAVIKVYTFFGISIQKIKVTCDGIYTM